MKTLTVELPLQTASKLETLEQKHGERLRQALGRMVTTVLEKIERAPETDLQSLEQAVVSAIDDDDNDAEFLARANYILDKNAELYRRLA